MARGRAGRGHGGENVRLTKGSKPLLALGIRVGPDGAPKRPLREQNECGAKRLCVEHVPEGDRGEVSAVSDEAGVLLVELGFHIGSTVLVQHTCRAFIEQAWSS